MPVIETLGLTKTFGKIRGIVDLNLYVNERDFFGFIGPNGAGKSTTIRTLFNMIFPTCGKVPIFGLDCVKESEKIKQIVGYVPSEVNYYPEMRVGELFKYAASFYKRVDNVIISRLTDCLEVDLKKKFGELSLGNRKKVAIVQALLHKPRLLVLDEPTNGLDPLIQNRLFEVLAEENKNGMTVFFSSHNLNEVQRHCSVIGIIKEGRLIEQKSTQELSGLQNLNIILSVKENADSLLDDLKQLSSNKIQHNGNEIIFSFSGDINRLISLLSKYNLNSIMVEEPTLEEAVMHYYEEGGHMQ